jgi:hypothetical protein
MICKIDPVDTRDTELSTRPSRTATEDLAVRRNPRNTRRPRRRLRDRLNFVENERSRRRGLARRDARLARAGVTNTGAGRIQRGEARAAAARRAGTPSASSAAAPNTNRASSRRPGVVNRLRRRAARALRSVAGRSNSRSRRR